MGLDMYINKVPLDYKETEKVCVTFEKELGEFVVDLVDAIPNLDDGIKKFHTKVKHLLQDEEAPIVSDEYCFDTVLRNSIIPTMLRGGDSEEIAWLLFNNFTLFNYNITDEDKVSVIEALNEVFSELEVSKEFVTRSEALTEMSDALMDSREELVYWRKYHALNTYILNTFGGGNCEDTILDYADMEKIAQFISNDEDTDDDRVEKLLEDWDSNKLYIYHPWW